MKAELMCYSGSDLLVVNAARTSFSKVKDEFDEKDEKLINFLAREKHLLPFRHPSITFRCSAPMFVARQLGKHQVGMSWSEESRRYISTEPQFYWPDKWRKRAENVKQGSSDEAIEEMLVPASDSYGDPQKIMEQTAEFCYAAYQDALASDMAPELARIILPQNMIINWVWTGTLLSWIHMVKQRTDSHTQAETREFAELVKTKLLELYPISVEALLKYE